MNKNEITLFSGDAKNVYTSVKKEEEVKNLYNALTGECILLNDIVGSEIKVKNVYVDEREIYNESTGEVTKKHRTVLIDENGQGYATGSQGVFNSLRTIFILWGYPDTWVEPKTFLVTKVKNNKTGFESLRLILK